MLLLFSYLSLPVAINRKYTSLHFQSFNFFLTLTLLKTLFSLYSYLVQNRWTANGCVSLLSLFIIFFLVWIFISSSFLFLGLWFWIVTDEAPYFSVFKIFCWNGNSRQIKTFLNKLCDQIFSSLIFDLDKLLLLCSVCVCVILKKTKYILCL